MRVCEVFKLIPPSCLVSIGTDDERLFKGQAHDLQAVAPNLIDREIEQIAPVTTDIGAIRGLPMLSISISEI